MMSVMSVNPPKRQCQQEKWNIEFGNEDVELMCDEDRNDPMVVTTTIADYENNEDGGGNILYEDQIFDKDRDQFYVIRPANSETISHVICEVSNMVVVKMENGKWKMCIDFTNLNKVCPKDKFPLPSIERLVDASAGHSLEVHVDDMLVKSSTMEEHLQNLLEVFVFLKTLNMNLNPKKYAFGVRADRFLGFMISKRGIEVNPKKIRSILEMPHPQTIKDIQCLMGRIVAINRFIFRVADKCLPFFKALRTSFLWTEECQIAFEKLNLYLTSPPFLKLPRVGETLYLYLATLKEIVAAVLVRAEDIRQFLVYYVSKIKQLARNDNTRADALSKLASSIVIKQRRKILLEYRDTSIYGMPHVLSINREETWITHIVRTLQGMYDYLDKKELIKLQRKFVRYTFLKGVLYREGSLYPLLRFLSPSEAEYVMRKIHEGIYGDHLGRRLLTQKIFRQSLRTTHFNEDVNQEAIKLNLDLINEFREASEIRNAERA
ncbi:Retrovirus-related Pol polyprotein from transposon 412 family [Gossypium australe]|uniref:Retrovirus-related Pol polyprotein from transposon 412 family n=1 Tax=Gossypium australe TaxID=47621 RepID=A0A5B6UFM8_9ROSI|nr:Retrovirus-related Pol polyprotein from transposon 412 family [Gossypium australe]